uniref:C-type lectin domain-containing protein n=1 Tax=Scophthalmus maximus TaxID=52904 RepID=A0A8D3D582_SCOMX
MLLWFLILKVAKSQSYLTTISIQRYFFVNDSKSWWDAQAHCRRHHTDLASVRNETENSLIQQVVPSGQRAAIGLHRRTWDRWSDGTSSTFSHWADGHPQAVGANCVASVIEGVHRGTWTENSCGSQFPFMCHNSELFSSPDKNAQMYCRTNHTDLAILFNDLISGIKQLEEFTVTESQKKMWIGLFRDKWRQSRTSSELSLEFVIDENPHWRLCLFLTDGMILIRENKTWEDAWIYCRENYEDLVSITDARQLELIAARAKMADTDHVWLGLRYNTRYLWFWVTGERFSYNRWDSDYEQKSRSCYASAAMETGGGHMWFQRDDDEKLNFICIK